MPKLQVDSYQAETLQELLHKKGATHLRTRKYGIKIIVESGTQRQRHKHMRFVRSTVHLWHVEFADHRGRWERTPFRDTMDNIVSMVFDDFPWMMADIFQYKPGPN